MYRSKKNFLLLTVRHLNWDANLFLPPYSSRLLLINLPCKRRKAKFLLFRRRHDSTWRIMNRACHVRSVGGIFRCFHFPAAYRRLLRVGPGGMVRLKVATLCHDTLCHQQVDQNRSAPQLASLRRASTSEQVERLNFRFFKTFN